MRNRIEAIILATNTPEVREAAARAKERDSLSNKPANQRALAKYAEAHPDRVAARHAVRDALKCNRIAKSDTCSFANQYCRGDLQAHHWRGYDEAHWLDVLWVCQQHHDLIEPEAPSVKVP